MKTYRKIATVKAKLFEEGDEDGMSCIPFVTQCVWKDPKGLYKNCKDCILEMPKRPYITELENDKFFGEWGENYLCCGIDGERWLVEKSIFERTYEVISSEPEICVDCNQKGSEYCASSCKEN